MKLVHPQAMTDAQERAYRLCLAQASIKLPRETALTTVIANLAAIEPETRLIRMRFPLPQLGVIDAIAVGRDGRPILIGVHDELTNDAVVASFAQADWLYTYRDLLAHYQLPIHLADDARIWHFASSVEPGVQPLLRRLGRMAPEVFLARCLSLGGEEWFVVEHLGKMAIKAELGHAPTAAPAKAPTTPQTSPSYRSILTEDEVGAFFSGGSLEEDDVTSRCALP